MSEFQDSQVAQTWTEPLPGGGSRTVRRYGFNYLERQDHYDVYYVQFTVAGDTDDLRIYYDQPIRSEHRDFWAASELWMEVDGGRELKYRKSKESNQLGYRAHFHFEQDGFNTYYNNRRVRFLLRTGTSQGVDSPFELYVDQYT